MRLTSLTARSVRGIPRNWPNLTIGERGLVVFGDNGVGKSSIIDALEYAISGKSSLYPVQRQNVTWENSSPHIRGGASEIAVSVAGEAGPLTLSANSVPENASAQERAWVAAGRSASFVMRRHMLLRFITEQPRNRYEQLEPFMSLGAYREVEDALKDWNETLTTARNGAVATVQEQETPIRRVFGLEQEVQLVEPVLIGRLNAVLRVLRLEDVIAAAQLAQRQGDIAILLGGSLPADRLATLGALRGEAQHLGTALGLAGLLEALVEAVEELEREMESRADAILTDLLVRGRQAIEGGGLTTCPLCEQDIDREAVIQRLNERIEADERITVGRQLVTRRRAELLQHLRPLSQSMARFCEHWAEHVDRPLPAAYGPTVALLAELEADLEAQQPRGARLREFLPRLGGCVVDHQPVIDLLGGLIANEGDGERRQRLDNAASMIEAMLADWPRYQAATIRARNLEYAQSVVGRLHGHAIEARKNAVRAMFDDLMLTANRYYEVIHPNEGIATSRLLVRDVGQGSATLSTIFHGNEENPLLHYSESHLDTLGLSYFLALRRYETAVIQTFRVLVLDDVMHSVDASHRGRIASLLRDEFSDHQIIITTHDIHFYEALRRAFDGSGFVYRRINNWDLERGPVFGDPLTDYDRIMVAAEREALGHETLSAAGGRFFEWLLREITEALEVAVPARFSRAHEIGQLWPALAAKLRRQGEFAAFHQPVIDGLNQNLWVRNACGAHHDDAPAPPTPVEVRAFARLLAALHDALYCEQCREFVTRQPNNDWRCACGGAGYRRGAR